MCGSEIPPWRGGVGGGVSNGWRRYVDAIGMQVHTDPHPSLSAPEGGRDTEVRDRKFHLFRLAKLYE